MEISVTDIEDVLDRHQTRRLDGLPTITTVLGSVPLSLSALRRWCRKYESDSVQSPIMTVVERPCDALDVWIDEVLLENRLQQNVHQVVAEIWKWSASEWARRCHSLTRREAETLFAGKDVHPGDHGRSGLAARLFQSPDFPDLSRQDIIKIAGLDSEDSLSRMSELFDLLGPTNLVFTPRSAADLLTTISQVSRWVTHVPRLLTTLVVDQSVWHTVMAAKPDGFEKALVSEHAFVLRGIAPNTLATRLARNGKPSDHHQRFADDLTRTVGELSEPLVDAFADTLVFNPNDSEATTFPVQPVVDDRFRSAAEKFLWELLEHHEETCGKFMPNSSPGFRFGSRQAEVDLLCSRLRIAIEVDGYYHFTDEVSYRRDREKDFLLQKHGYLVLRFLAQDVVSEMEKVLHRVVEAVRYAAGSNDDV